MLTYAQNLDEKHRVHRAKYSLIYATRWLFRNSRVPLPPSVLRWSFVGSVDVSFVHKYKLIRQGIRKNATTTLYNWELMLDGLLKPGETKGHTKLSEKRKAQFKLFNTIDLLDYRHFTFVRNPFARLVSSFFSHWGTSLCTSPETLYKDHFEEYIRTICNIPNHMQNLHQRTQHSLLYFPTLDFIGRIENFSDDMRKMIDRYQLPPESYDLIPHLKKGKYGDYRKYYSTATRTLVEKYYRKDLDTFGYSF